MSAIKRILLAMPQTAGDVFICTGLLPQIKAKWPEADIYFATEKRYFDILDGNPHVKRVIEYHKAMLNYRNFETWGPQKNTFDIVFHPNIVTQHIPHWIHGGHGEYLGDVYRHMCCLDDYGPQFLAVREDPSIVLPAEYVTVHAKTNQDPKDYDHIQSVVDRICGVPVVQVGGKEDPELQGVTLDLRGKTTPQSLAWVIKGAKLHLGLDSFPMHVAMHVNTPSVILFGGTYAKQGVWPKKANLVTAMEPDYRFMCPTSCHLVHCEMKKIGLDKCINNISVDSVIREVGGKIGGDKVVPPEPIKLSAYMILRDGIKYGFPFQKSIEAAAKIVDEVVVVDGGSTDGTLETLEIMKSRLSNLRVFRTKWDMDSPTLFGDEKTHARRCCEVGNHLIQIDADEVIHEPRPGAFRELVEKHRDADVLDIPVINFYGDPNTVRIESVSWKWRVSKNHANIIHGVHGAARFADDRGRIVMDKRVSDGCEYVYADSLSLARHKVVFPIEYEQKHQDALKNEPKRQAYAEYLKKMVAEQCLVFHYSWLNLSRKEGNGVFWDQTWHGKRKATHNTTEDIGSRIKEGKDVLLKVDLDHPLKDV